MTAINLLLRVTLLVNLLLPTNKAIVESKPIDNKNDTRFEWLPSPDDIDLSEDSAVRNLRHYLRIQSVHPDPDKGYRQAIVYLQVQAREIGLEFKLADLGQENEFAVIMTWQGSDPTLKSVLFNSHMDVVATEPQFWNYPPFEAHKDSQGNIYARGASDMKSATQATLEALRKLKQSGFQPLRTIHVTVLPDEELGGLRGMKPFISSTYFKDLNVGIDIDEGGVNPNKEIMFIYFGEKSAWQFRITAFGDEGHGATLKEYSSGQRIQLVIDRLLKFRRDQYLKLQSPGVTLDQLTTVNLVGIRGGIQANVIPSKLWAEFDMRLRRTDYSFTDIDNMLEDIIEEAASLGSNNTNEVIIEYLLKSMETAETVANNSNVWWNVVQDACREMKISCPATFASPVSDARYVRAAGIPAFGIGPFLNTPFKAHTNNEFINEAEYLHGIDRYVVLMRHLAMQPDQLF